MPPADPTSHRPRSRQPTTPPADDPFAGLETAELADRLSTVAATVAVAESEFLDLLGEFDAREGWAESGGLRSTAHWLSWRVGYRLGVAREKVRVARALRRLPLLRATFGQGRLSYCKVRAVSRVATTETETELVQIALGATGAQLETVVRSWRRTLLGESGASSHATRRVRRRVEEDGSVVFTIRLTATEAPLLDSAMDLGVPSRAGRRTATSSRPPRSSCSPTSSPTTRLPCAPKPTPWSSSRSPSWPPGPRARPATDTSWSSTPTWRPSPPQRPTRPPAPTRAAGHRPPLLPVPTGPTFPRKRSTTADHGGLRDRTDVSAETPAALGDDSGAAPAPGRTGPPGQP